MTTVTAQRIVLSAVLAAFGGGCALSRSHVKSLRDRDAGRIQLETVTHTTVAALNAIRSQCGPATDHRARDEEFRVYDVVGRVARVKRERDHDIHVVLEDPDDPRERMVVESDDPDFRGNVASPYREKLAAARQMFDDLVKQSGARQLNDLRGTIVRVTGVGFFDMNHLQIGRSRSCIELHPILAIERVSEQSSKPVTDARFNSSSAFHSLRSSTHNVAARFALMGLFVLRHVGLGPHIHTTSEDAPGTSQVAQLWTEPTDLEARDLFAGSWGLDAAPNPDGVYSFVAEKKPGFSPGYDVKAPDGTEWSVKMGPEAQTEVVASRLLWAVGYHQPPVYYLPRWTLSRGSSAALQGPARFRPKMSALSAKRHVVLAAKSLRAHTTLSRPPGADDDAQQHRPQESEQRRVPVG